MLSLINSSSSYKLNQLAIPLEQENLRVERKNLINIFKLVVKTLIESSSSLHNVDNFDKSLIDLSDFFDVFENILNHGFKGSKKGFYSGYQRSDYTSLLDLIELKLDDSKENFTSIKDMTEIKTSLGKLRAWIRILVMQKHLADDFTSLIQKKQALEDLYDSEALLLSEEANVISGLLIGLNGLDFSIDLKSIIVTLDLPIRVVDYSTYLREKIPDLENVKEKTEDEEEKNIKFYEILDQKNYLEEINKSMKAQLDTLNKRTNDLEITSEELKSEVMKLKLENIEHKNTIEALEVEKDKIEQEYKVKFDSVYMDQMTERETFVNSKNGLDQMYIELQKKILDESKQKLSLENELKTQQMMKSELEGALKLMDHSLVDKQNSINKLREQLEQVKGLNIELNTSLNGFDAEKKAINNELEAQTEKLKVTMTEIEQLKQSVKIKEDLLKKKTQAYERASNDMLFFQKKRDELEVDVSIEKNWRQELQAELNTQQGLTRDANAQISALTDIKSENEKLKIEISNLKLVNAELEKTLEEMGSKLGVSVVKMEDIKEVTKQLSEYQWEQDDQVTICKQCNHEFNVARRKHHCRRCGRIFCHDCSDNKMPLPSFSKPVRVCDPCCDLMLQSCTK